MGNDLDFGTQRPHVRRLCASAVLALFACCALAQPSDGIVARYPAGSINSVEQADAALTDVARERREIDSRFASEEQACHPKFFATPCLDKAKERRREASMALRHVEIEAQAFKRRARVADREQALEQRQAKEETGREERARQLPESEGREEPRAQAEHKEPSPRPENRHKPKEEPLDAEKRAENIAAYERKVEAANKRQKEVAERKAEKERKRQRKETQAQ
jgi:colicin import membrane protein